jgi:hypothetical protein
MVQANAWLGLLLSVGREFNPGHQNTKQNCQQLYREYQQRFSVC